MTKKERSDNTKRSKRDMKQIITRPAEIQAAEFLRNETVRYLLLALETKSTSTKTPGQPCLRRQAATG